MARRRNKIEVLEDGFADLTLDEKRRLMPVLQGLLRQQERNGAAIADADLETSKTSKKTIGAQLRDEKTISLNMDLPPAEAVDAETGSILEAALEGLNG